MTRRASASSASATSARRWRSARTILPRTAIELAAACGSFTPPMKEFLPTRETALRGEPGIREMLASFDDLAQKDLAQAIAYARDLGIELPGAARCRDLMWEVYGIGHDAPDRGDGGNDG